MRKREEEGGEGGREGRGAGWMERILVGDSQGTR